MDPGAIRDQVDRILNSQSFSTKGQLRRLLEVLRAHMDLQAALTTELVIRELWPAETKTKQARDVATEMNRLRRAVESYYNEEGETDLVIIYFPKRAPAGNGHPEARWIDAIVRDSREAHEPVALSSLATAQAERPQSLTQIGRRQGWKRVALIAALCLLGILGYLSFRLLAVPDQPKFGRLDGSSLVIMNATGKVLWVKNFPDGFSTDWYFENDIESRLWIGDLEGKGRTSILFAYAPADPRLHSSALICYSDGGKEKWRWTPGRELPELAGSPATFRTAALRVLKAADKQPRRIVVASIHELWWPAQIAVVDPYGKTASEYWHSGALTCMTLADLDGDGREEIIATGVANGYDHRATLVVLDPDRVSGASTEGQPEFQIHGMGVAQERLRLLFPRSDLNRATFQYNWAIEPTPEPTSTRLAVTECPFPPVCRIWYEFDKSFRLIAAYAGGDEFRSAHERFYQNRKDAHPLSAEEQAAFQKVRCLVGCKTEFVPVGKLVP